MFRRRRLCRGVVWARDGRQPTGSWGMGLREKQGCPGGSGAVRIGVWGSRVEPATRRWPGLAQPFAMLSRHVSLADRWAWVPACGGCCKDVTRVGRRGPGPGTAHAVRTPGAEPTQAAAFPPQRPQVEATLGSCPWVTGPGAAALSSPLAEREAGHRLRLGARQRPARGSGV